MGHAARWERVFEVLSPNNTALEMIDKFNAYARFGVEEYYLYDPEKKEFRAWTRRGEALDPVQNVRRGRSFERQPRLRGPRPSR